MLVHADGENSCMLLFGSQSSAGDGRTSRRSSTTRSLRPLCLFHLLPSPFLHLPEPPRVPFPDKKHCLSSSHDERSRPPPSIPHSLKEDSTSLFPAACCVVTYCVFALLSGASVSLSCYVRAIFYTTYILAYPGARLSLSVTFDIPATITFRSIYPSSTRT